MPRPQASVEPGTRNGRALRVLGMVRAMRAFEKRHLQILKTLEDCDLVCEIGYHQQARKPLTLKQIFLLGIGSVATVQRRLRRLRRLGAIEQQPCPHDRRVKELTLSPKLLGVFARCAEVLPRER